MCPPVPPHLFEASKDDPDRCAVYVHRGQRCGYEVTNANVHAPGAIRLPPPLRSVPPVDSDHVSIAMDAPPTSVAAAAVARTTRGKVRRGVLSLAAHPTGVTDWEAEGVLDESHQTVSSARNSLMRDGLVERMCDVDGQPVVRRTKRSQAQVWTITTAGRAALAAGRQAVGA